MATFKQQVRDEWDKRVELDTRMHISKVITNIAKDMDCDINTVISYLQFTEVNNKYVSEAGGVYMVAKDLKPHHIISARGKHSVYTGYCQVKQGGSVITLKENEEVIVYDKFPGGTYWL